MRIVHLLTMDTGGAAIAALELHHGLLAQNVDSSVLVQNKSRDSRNVFSLDPQRGSKQFPNAVSRLKEVSKERRSYVGSSGNQDSAFSDDRSAFDLSNDSLLLEADIVHLHWVSGMLDIDSFFSSYRGKAPIVWTLHDMNPFTGGCHYAGACTKYIQNCGACPLLASSVEGDFSRDIWSRKKAAYSKSQLAVIASSNWSANCAKSSSLMQGVNVSTIPYGIDVEKFSPLAKKDAREELGIDFDGLLIGFGYDYDTPRKGFDLFRSAIKELAADENCPPFGIVFFGKTSSKDLSKDIPIFSLGYLDSAKNLREFYSALDLFVAAASEEAFGLTCVEAMSCATPVVATAVGGHLDTIASEKTGLLVELDNPKLLAGSVLRLFKDEDLRVKLAGNAVEHVAKNFSSELQAIRHIEFYHSLVSQRD